MKKLKLIAALLTGMMMTNEAWGTSSTEKDSLDPKTHKVKDELTIHVQFLWKKSLKTLEMSPSRDFKYLKEIIARKRNCDPETLVLFFNGGKIADNYTLDQFNKTTTKNPIFVYFKNFKSNQNGTLKNMDSVQEYSVGDFNMITNKKFKVVNSARFLHKINKGVEKDGCCFHSLKGRNNNNNTNSTKFIEFCDYIDADEVIIKKIEDCSFFVEKCKSENSTTTLFYCRNHFMNIYYDEYIPKKKLNIVMTEVLSFDKTLFFFQKRSPSLAPERIKQLVTDSILFDKPIVYDFKNKKFILPLEYDFEKEKFIHPSNNSLRKALFIVGVVGVVGVGIAGVYYFFFRKKTPSTPKKKSRRKKIKTHRGNIR